MDREERSDRFAEIEDRFADYEAYDRHGEKIGKVDDLFLDENDQPEYLGEDRVLRLKEHPDTLGDGPGGRGPACRRGLS